MSEWEIAILRQFSNNSFISLREQVNFQWNDDGVRFVLDQHAELDFYSASSLKQQSAGRHVAPLGHIFLIPSQPVFVSFFFGLTRPEPELEHTIDPTRDEHANNYATDAVKILKIPKGNQKKSFQVFMIFVTPPCLWYGLCLLFASVFLFVMLM